MFAVSSKHLNYKYKKGQSKMLYVYQGFGLVSDFIFLLKKSDVKTWCKADLP